MHCFISLFSKLRIKNSLISLGIDKNIHVQRDMDRLDIIQNTTIIYNIDDNVLIREDNQEIAGAL